MKRPILVVLIAALLCGAAALAQSGLLAGVTMRVVDDISGLDAVVIHLPPAPAAD